MLTEFFTKYTLRGRLRWDGRGVKDIALFRSTTSFVHYLKVFTLWCWSVQAATLMKDKGTTTYRPAGWQVLWLT